MLKLTELKLNLNLFLLPRDSIDFDPLLKEDWLICSHCFFSFSNSALFDFKQSKIHFFLFHFLVENTIHLVLHVFYSMYMIFRLFFKKCSKILVKEICPLLPSNQAAQLVAPVLLKVTGGGQVHHVLGVLAARRRHCGTE